MNIEQKKDGNALTLVLEGRLDTMTAPQLEAALQEALPGVEELTFDFEKLEYISSAGLRLLVSLQKKAAASGKTMVIRNPNAVVKEVFRVSGFNKTFTVL